VNYSELVIPWQRASIQAAAAYLRERISQGDADRRTKAIYEGLLEVLDPTRRATRLQRELAAAAQAAVTGQVARDRRGGGGGV
jgi:transposase